MRFKSIRSKLIRWINRVEGTRRKIFRTKTNKKLTNFRRRDRRTNERKFARHSSHSMNFSPIFWIKAKRNSNRFPPPSGSVILLDRSNCEVETRKLFNDNLGSRLTFVWHSESGQFSERIFSRNIFKSNREKKFFLTYSTAIPKKKKNKFNFFSFLLDIFFYDY